MPADVRRPVAIWVGGPCNQAGEAKVIATLKAANIPPAAGVLRVGGARPGRLADIPALHLFLSYGSMLCGSALVGHNG